jgi:hypothetical protein
MHLFASQGENSPKRFDSVYRRDQKFKSALRMNALGNLKIELWLSHFRAELHFCLGKENSKNTFIFTYGINRHNRRRRALRGCNPPARTV